MNKVQYESFLILNEIDKLCKKHEIDYFLSSGTLLGAVRHEGFIPWDDDLDLGMTRDNYDKFIKVAYQELDASFFLQINQTEPYYFNSFAKIRSNRLNVIERTTQYSPIHQGAWVDIFPYDRLPSSSVERKQQFKEIKRIDELIRKFTYIYPSENDNFLKKYLKTFIQLFNSKFIKLYKFLPKLVDERNEIIQRYNGKNGKIWSMLSYPLTDKDYQTHWVYEEEIMELVELKFEGKYYKAPKKYHEILTRQYGDYLKLPPEKERKPSHFIKVEGA